MDNVGKFWMTGTSKTLEEKISRMTRSSISYVYANQSGEKIHPWRSLAGVRDVGWIQHGSDTRRGTSSAPPLYSPHSLRIARAQVLSPPGQSWGGRRFHPSRIFHRLVLWLLLRPGAAGGRRPSRGDVTRGRFKVPTDFYLTSPNSSVGWLGTYVSKFSQIILKFSCLI